MFLLLFFPLVAGGNYMLCPAFSFFYVGPPGLRRPLAFLQLWYVTLVRLKRYHTRQIPQ